MSTQYEFKSLSVHQQKLDDSLTAHSAEGWEIEKMLSPKEQIGTTHWFVLLRRLMRDEGRHIPAHQGPDTDGCGEHVEQPTKPPVRRKAAKRGKQGK